MYIHFFILVLVHLHIHSLLFCIHAVLQTCIVNKFQTTFTQLHLAQARLAQSFSTATCVKIACWHIQHM